MVATVTSRGTDQMSNQTEVNGRQVPPSEKDLQILEGPLRRWVELEV